MDHKAIVKACKELGCCDVCCLRYIGLKNPVAFENAQEYVGKYLEAESESTKAEETLNSSAEVNEDDEVPAKKCKTSQSVCVSCVGVLQEENWPACGASLKEMIDNKKYECPTFACALSPPVVTILREKAVTLHLQDIVAEYDDSRVTPLKEAWKWSRGALAARALGKELAAGGAAPLLVTLAFRYEAERAELRALGAPPAAAGRRAAAAAASRLARAALAAAEWAPPPAPRAPAQPAAAAEHEPLHVGGRYVKRSRALPQTPWVLRGERVMPSSVQEIIFAPLARLFRVDEAQAERRLKFVSAGREDVDVRCLGTGRPFAVEVADPQRAPTADELRRVCDEISESGIVSVDSLVLVSKEKLAELKRGEETKCKTYEALCIKLGHTAEDIAEGATAGSAVAVSARDVARAARWRGAVVQRTPLRVLHRRAWAARARRVEGEAAARVAGGAALLALRVRTAAGTYVKEWAHGDLRRSAPALAAALGAPVDIVALDVTHVHLDWP